MGTDWEATSNSPANAIPWAAARALLPRKSGQDRDCCFPRNMRQHQIARELIEAIGIGKIFADRMIRQMPRAAKHPLLYHPWIRPDLQHVQIVIRFQHQAVRPAQMDFHQLRHVSQIGTNRDFRSIGAERKSDGSAESCGIGTDASDVSDGEALAGVNGFGSAQAFCEKHRAERDAVSRWLGNVKRRLPDSQHLRQSAAMVRMFVSDQDAVKVVNFAADGGKTGECFSFAKTGVHKDAGVFGFEQRQLPDCRTPGWKHASRWSYSPKNNKTFPMMAERKECVNACAAFLLRA